jgi:hypothetical protein
MRKRGEAVEQRNTLASVNDIVSRRRHIVISKQVLRVKNTIALGFDEPRIFAKKPLLKDNSATIILDDRIA